MGGARAEIMSKSSCQWQHVLNKLWSSKVIRQNFEKKNLQMYLQVKKRVIYKQNTCQLMTCQGISFAVRTVCQDANVVNVQI